jgi:hypothetical protein
MNLFDKPPGVQTRWASFENPTAERNAGALKNQGAKGCPSDRVPAGTSRTLLDVSGSGVIRRIWMTLMDRSPEMLRGMRLDMYWDGAETPAVSCPIGDFFGVGLGRRARFESALLSDPEGRSFNCFIPMPFRKAARIVLTNESGRDQTHLFYDVDFELNVEHTPAMLYFHTHWRRESPNELGRDFLILPPVPGNGRFLGCNIGVITNPAYGDTWWGEGEVKVWLGDDRNPTLCGTGTEDYIGTAWGQGTYSHRTQGCLVADRENGHWAFYRYHVDDAVYFDGGCKVAIQTIGGSEKAKVLAVKEKAPLIPVAFYASDRSIPPVLFFESPQPPELEDPSLMDGWCNFWRQDDWSAAAYFYMDSPGGALPSLPSASMRMAGLKAGGDVQARADT